MGGVNWIREQSGAWADPGGGADDTVGGEWVKGMFRGAVGGGGIAVSAVPASDVPKSCGFRAGSADNSGAPSRGGTS